MNYRVFLDTQSKQLLQAFEKDARRHRELIATLRTIREDVSTVRRSYRRVKSPVRKSLAGSPTRRVFGFSFA